MANLRLDETSEKRDHFSRIQPALVIQYQIGTADRISFLRTYASES